MIYSLGGIRQIEDSGASTESKEQINIFLISLEFEHSLRRRWKGVNNWHNYKQRIAYNNRDLKTSWVNPFNGNFSKKKYDLILFRSLRSMDDNSDGKHF